MQRRRLMIGLFAVLILGLGAGAAAVAYAGLKDSSRLSTVAASAMAALQGEVPEPAGGVQAAAGSALTPAQSAATPAEPGLVIVRVQADSPAAAAGLKRGDILLEVEGEAINTLRELRGRLADFSAGDSVGVTVLHGDDRRILVVTLGGEETPFLGIVTWSDDMLRSQPMPTNVLQSALVVEVNENGPAAAAGLQADDQINAIDGEMLSQPLAAALQSYAPGDVIVLGIVRGDAALELTVTLGAHPDDAERPYLGIGYRQLLTSSSGRRVPGGEDRPFFEDPSRYFDMAPGALVSEVVDGSAAAGAGLVPGDLITHVDGVALASPADLVDAIAGREPGSTVILTVQSAEAEPRDVEVILGQGDAGNALLGVRLAPHGFFIPGLDEDCLEANGAPCVGGGQFFRFSLPFPNHPALPAPLDNLPGIDDQSA